MYVLCSVYKSRYRAACCAGCPGNARIFGDLDDPDSEISQYLKGKESFVLGEEYGTNPKVLYISSKRGIAEGD